MDRMACVDIRQMPLQVLLHKNPSWKKYPVAVVDRDKPNGTILYINKRGRARRILPGLSYGTGLSLCRDLRAGVVSKADIDGAVADLTDRLWQFSPRIEPCEHEPGVFWLDASGLGQLYASLDDWAESIRSTLNDAGFRALVAVGFSRFGSYATARSNANTMVFRDAQEERKHFQNITLNCLNVEPRLRDTLFRLGITTLGGFLALPFEGIRKRFGPEAEALHEMARGKQWRPLAPCDFFDPVKRSTVLGYTENDIDRLLFIVANLLTSMLRELSQRHQALKELHLELELDDGSKKMWSVAPAKPTLDSKQILVLVRLRLERFVLSSEVEEIKIRATGETASSQQLELYHDAAKHNLQAANQAISQLRAFLNQDSVVCARLHDGHLPEAQFHWEPVHELQLPQPAAAKRTSLVKRFFSPPKELPARDRREPDGWLVAGRSEGPVEEVRGPYFVSGGWWIKETARVYYYIRTRSGRWLWIYCDEKRRRWFLHGEVQ